MTTAEVLRIRETFRLSQRDLAKALNVSPATVARWETGESDATGLQDEVLRALHNVALRVEGDRGEADKMAGLIALGIGALIFYLLTKKG